MRATGRIVTLRGRGEIPRLSAEARLVHGELAPRAQVGRVADAVEVHDPSGILTVAEDLPGGAGVRLGVSGAVAASPGDGVMFAVPLVDPRGRPHPPIERHLRYPSVHGTLGWRALSDWTTKAIPSGAAAFVGLLAGPPGVAEYGAIWGTINSAPGQAQQFVQAMQAGAWGGLAVGPPDATQSGTVTTVGHGAGWNAEYGQTAMPWDGWDGGISQRALVAAGDRILWRDAPGAIPHLVWGVYQPTAGPGGVIEMLPVAECWSLDDAPWR